MEYEYVVEDGEINEDMTMIKCGDKCSEGMRQYKLENGQIWCLKFCPEEAVFEASGVCMDNCAAYVLQTREEKEVMICQDDCGLGEFSDYKYFEQNGTSKNCIKECYGNNKYLVKKECVSECPSGMYANYTETGEGE